MWECGHAGYGRGFTQLACEVPVVRKVEGRVVHS